MSAPAFAASFAALYAGHMVGDHIAQTHAQSIGKAAPTGWVKPMLGHLASYAICQMAAFYALAAFADFRMAAVGWYLGIPFSVVTHGFIDRRWPVRWLLEHTGSKPFADLASSGINGMYLADQSLHVGCLFVSALLIGGLS